MIVCGNCCTPIMWLETAFDGPISNPFVYCEGSDDTFCKFENDRLYCRSCNAQLSWSTRDPFKIEKRKTKLLSIHDAWFMAADYIYERFRVRI